MTKLTTEIVEADAAQQARTPPSVETMKDLAAVVLREAGVPEDYDQQAVPAILHVVKLYLGIAGMSMPGMMRRHEDLGRRMSMASRRRCEVCGPTVPIVWAVDTADGAKIPLDGRGVYLLLPPDQPDGMVRCRRFEGAFVSHYRTCKDPGAFSGKH